MRSWTLLLFLLFLLLPLPAIGAIDAYPFPNDEMRERYNVLIDELRCPQCLNTNIAGSDAMIAKDLRREVHRLVLEGKSDDEILEFMHERYGDFILYKPRVNVRTMVLWFGPVVLLLIALGVAARLVNDRRRRGPAVLSEVDQDRLNKLLLKK